MLWRAADSPLMKNKTPVFYSSSSFSSSWPSSSSSTPFVRIALSPFYSFLALSLFFWFLLSPYTYTHYSRRHHRVCSRRHHRWLYTYFLLRLVFPIRILWIIFKSINFRQIVRIHWAKKQNKKKRKEKHISFSFPSFSSFSSPYYYYYYYYYYYLFFFFSLTTTI